MHLFGGCRRSAVDAEIAIDSTRVLGGFRSGHFPFFAVTPIRCSRIIQFET